MVNEYEKNEPDTDHLGRIVTPFSQLDISKLSPCDIQLLQELGAIERDDEGGRTAIYIQEARRAVFEQLIDDTGTAEM